MRIALLPVRLVRTFAIAAACAVICVCAAANAASARAPIPERVVVAQQPLTPYMAVFNDASGRLDIHDVARQPASRFIALNSVDESSVTRCRWYRFTLANSLARRGSWVLLAEADAVTLYEPAPRGYHAESFGTSTPVAARRLQNGMSDVDLPSGDFGPTLYVRIVGPPGDVLAIKARSDIDRLQQSRDLIGVFLIAIFTLLAVTAFVFALITRVPEFSFYGIYMTMQTLSIIDTLPVAARSLWPQAAPSAFLIDIVVMFVAPLAFAYFFRYALNTLKTPVYDRWLIASGYAGAIVGTTCRIIDYLNGTEYVNTVSPFIYIAMPLVTAGIAFIRLRERYVSAGIYLVGLAGVAVGMGLYPFYPQYHPMVAGFIWEAVAFLVAIAYRLAITTQERARALAEAVIAKDAIAHELELRAQTTEAYNAAFARFVPRAFLEQLGRNDVREVVLGDHTELEMNVLFCDIRSFVALSENLNPQATFTFLNRYFGQVGPIIRANNGFIDQYLGDGLKAMFPSRASDDAMRAAIALHREVRRFNEARAREGERLIDIGVALHRGPVILATIGEQERFDTTVVTEVVNVAARLEGLTKVYGARIIVSQAIVANLLEPEAFNLRSLGDLQVAGSGKQLTAFEVCDGDSAELLLHKRATAQTFEAGITAYRSGSFMTASKIFGELARQEPRDTVAQFFADRSRRRTELGNLSWDGIDRHEIKG